MIRVTLAGTFPINTLERFRSLLPADQFQIFIVSDPVRYAEMTDAEVMVLRDFKASREFIERNPSLKMILRWGVGVDSVDIAAAGEHGIPVTNTPGANANAVSELAVMLMLAVGRKLLCHAESLHRGTWSQSTYLNSSFCLNGKLVGIVGCGNIGRQVATKVQTFGARVQYYDVFRLPEEMEETFRMTYVPLKEVLATSDIVTLHIPLLDSTWHIVGAKELASMKTGAILINTARGGLVDDRALAKAVRDGKLAGAGLDVVEKGVLSADDELLQDPNIIVTPHIGGGTADIADVIIPMLVENIKAFVARETLAYVVNKQYLK